MFNLTNRQLQVAMLYARGYKTNKIAEYLGLRPATVQSHLKKAIVKTGTKNRYTLACLIIKSGIVYEALPKVKRFKNDIIELLNQGKNPKQIARLVKCTIQYVYHVQRKTGKQIFERKIFEIDGKTKKLSELISESQINKNTIYYRINKGWDIQKSLTDPVQYKKEKANATKNIIL